MVVRSEVYFHRVKHFPKMVQTFWISPDPIINTLFGISERKQCAVLSKRLNYMPPICIGILEFIQNDDRVQGGDDFWKAFPPWKNFPRVSTNSSKQMRPSLHANLIFSAFSFAFFSALSASKLRLGGIAISNFGKRNCLFRFWEDEEFARQPNQIAMCF